MRVCVHIYVLHTYCIRCIETFTIQVQSDKVESTSFVVALGGFCLSFGVKIDSVKHTRMANHNSYATAGHLQLPRYLLRVESLLKTDSGYPKVSFLLS